MDDRPNKSPGFWQELRRRRVPRSLAIYGGSAFIILEAATIIFPRWGLPDWTIDLVLYLLILGAAITIVLAWIFDITPDGIRKTKPVEETGEREVPAESGGWKIATYISLVVIVVLIIFNVLSSSKTARAVSLQSLVVLPFQNFTGDDSLDFLVSGMHAALTGDMGKISAMRVIGNTSSNTYKDANMSLPEIARELNVEGAVETAVLCAGDSICFQVKVLSAFPEEKQLWTSEFKVARDQILNLNGQIAKQIASEVRIELTQEEELLFARDRTVDREAFDAYMHARLYWDDLSSESLYKAKDYLESAVEKDPEWAAPFAALAQVWVGIAQMGYESPDVAGPLIFGNLGRALELDPDFPDCHFINGIISVWQMWNWEKGEQDLLRAIAVNPNDAMSRVYYAHLLMILQRSEEAVTQGQLAVELDPRHPLIQALYSVVLVDAGEWERARYYIKKALELEPGHDFAIMSLEYIAFHDQVFEELMQYIKHIQPLDEEALLHIEEAHKDRGFNAAYEEFVHQLELYAEKEFLGPLDLALRYASTNQLEKAMEMIEAGFSIRDPNMPYITSELLLNKTLFENPRFIAIVEKMNLPPPVLN